MGQMAGATRILTAIVEGRESATHELLPLVYAELRALAAQHLQQERQDHTLQPTALVHEAYLRMIDQSCQDWKSRAHFFAVASVMIRRILVDHARARATRKRGGDRQRVSLDSAQSGQPDQPDEIDVLALDEAMIALRALNERQCRVVELRYFGGLSVEETAHVLEISPATVKSDFRLARAWLRHRLED